MRINTKKILLLLLFLLLITIIIFSFTKKEKNEVNEEKSPISFTTYFKNYIKKNKQSGENIQIAVLDTGIDLEQSDFKNSIIATKNFSDSLKEVNDINGHGTKIASIIGANKDFKNLVGIAPNAKFLIAKVANDDGYFKNEWLTSGIRWAINNDADIINISLENKTDDIELTKAIQEAISKKIYVVVSIGNNEIKSKISTIENVISVAPTKLKSKSLFNELDLDKNPTLFVPGEDVLSDYLLDKMTYDAGASFSTAITSGSIALILSNNRDAKKEEVITILKKMYSQPN